MATFSTAARRLSATSSRHLDVRRLSTTPGRHLDVGIVGLGTAGAAAAIFLARQGHRVKLFEKTPEGVSFVDLLKAAVPQDEFDF